MKEKCEEAIVENEKFITLYSGAIATLWETLVSMMLMVFLLGNA